MKCVVGVRLFVAGFCDQVCSFCFCPQCLPTPSISLYSFPQDVPALRLGVFPTDAGRSGVISAVAAAGAASRSGAPLVDARIRADTADASVDVVVAVVGLALADSVAEGALARAVVVAVVVAVVAMAASPACVAVCVCISAPSLERAMVACPRANVPQIGREHPSIPSLTLWALTWALQMSSWEMVSPWI